MRSRIHSDSTQPQLPHVPARALSLSQLALIMSWAESLQVRAESRRGPIISLADCEHEHARRSSYTLLLWGLIRSLSILRYLRCFHRSTISSTARHGM
jgi:hypothetical protein